MLEAHQEEILAPQGQILFLLLLLLLVAVVVPPVYQLERQETVGQAGALAMMILAQPQPLVALGIHHLLHQAKAITVVLLKLRAAAAAVLAQSVVIQQQYL